MNKITFGVVLGCILWIVFGEPVYLTMGIGVGIGIMLLLDKVNRKT